MTENVWFSYIDGLLPRLFTNNAALIVKYPTEPGVTTWPALLVVEGLTT
jgi:hypothetical protein